MSTPNFTLKSALLWTGLYFCVILCYTSADILLWRTLPGPYSHLCNLLTIFLCSLWFLYRMAAKTGAPFRPLEPISLKNLTMAMACSLFFYLALDLGLDLLLANLFPTSETNYQAVIAALASAPAASFVRVCLLAPFVEEHLMRGLILKGLHRSIGPAGALLLSSLLFALLHFNMVQTLSALICGLVLGVLYLKTRSVTACILAHAGYNMISYFVVLLPFFQG